jgi:DNA-binding XRE family transcriptional regulator
MDFTVLKRAGVSQGQFAALVGVSRITANTWVRGHFKPRAPLAPRVRALLRLLHEAVEVGVLPVSVVDQKAATDAALELIRKRLNAGT